MAVVAFIQHFCMYYTHTHTHNLLNRQTATHGRQFQVLTDAIALMRFQKLQAPGMKARQIF
jgi:hypothetical protein